MTPQLQRSVLALNRGSSSVKFGLFTFGHEPSPLVRGSVTVSTQEATVSEVLTRVAPHLDSHPLAAIGHRLVHGGPRFSAPALVTDPMLAALTALMAFAPNHLPDEIGMIKAVQRLRPGVPQFACFDTAFHAGMPDVARALPIPEKYAAQGVRRYGFHGLSYTFLMSALARRSAAAADGRIVLMHLGSGSSVAAVDQGRDIDTSMGFTPLGGVMMGTRPGDLDPGVVVQMARLGNAGPDTLERELSHESGLSGVSGGFSDMRELLAREETDPRCRLAVAMYCYDIRKTIGAYAAALGGLDALVFSGGIGEHVAVVRARICASLAFLGVAVDHVANERHAPVISTADARVAVHVIPTDEEIVMATAAWSLLTGND